jgi:hypothetical protein
MNTPAIPKDKITEIIQKRGQVEISGIASELIQSGYKQPETPATEGERINPFIAALEKTLDEMRKEGTIKAEQIGGKTLYEISE